ncbi:hypothetical protein I3W98_41375, partial [Streptomyces cavourensis]|nr:hypothetical protein [Streptomyces cavourensis]
ALADPRVTFFELPTGHWPVKPPKYGRARAVHEWRTAARWILAAAVALGLLQAAIWYVGPGGDISTLQSWQQKMGLVIGINLIIAGGYTLFPKQAPKDADADAVGREPADRL